MKLYELLFRHYSPKDSKEGTMCYLVANSDEEVYEYIKSEPTLPDGTKLYVSWSYLDNPDNDEYDALHKERLIKCGGEIFDDEEEVSDAYYGVTHYGWKCVNENISLDKINILQEIGATVININEE